MVPAYNEEAALGETIQEIKNGLRNKVSDFEILIFDDGSRDQTGEVADKLALKDNKVRVFHNGKNRGTGYSYLQGLRNAFFEYYMYIPGDNEFPQKALIDMIKHLGEADIIIPFVKNMYIRPLKRIIISNLFTFCINFLFGLKIKYYNAPVIHKTELLRGVDLGENSGHAYQAAVLVSLIKAGASYVEVGYLMKERSTGGSAALKPKNILRVFETIISFFIDTIILRKSLVSPSVAKKLSVALLGK